MKRILALTLGVVVSLSMMACGSEAETVSYEESTESTALYSSSDVSGIYTVELEVQNEGTIVMELDADTAPISVANFLSLAEEGFYDGLTFHRIIEGFMVQGGDPIGNGTGGSYENITGEFSENGIANDISHTRGVVSMARSNEYDSASSQFFIVHKDSTFLDGSYAAFGWVTEGMDVVDSLATGAIVEDGNGTVASENQPVISGIKIIG